jgi:hypothetical protein
VLPFLGTFFLKFKLLFSKSLLMALFASYGGPFTVAAGFKILQDSLSFLQPQLLRLFLSFISAYQSARLNNTNSKHGPSPLEGFSIATAMFVTAIIQSIILHQVRVPPDRLSLSLTSSSVFPTLLRDWYASSHGSCYGHLSKGPRIVERRKRKSVRGHRQSYVG